MSPDVDVTQWRMKGSMGEDWVPGLRSPEVYVSLGAPQQGHILQTCTVISGPWLGPGLALQSPIFRL